MPVPNPKNLPASPVMADLGMDAMMNPDLVEDAEAKKRKTLAAQAGQNGMNLFGSVADIFGIGK